MYLRIGQAADRLGINQHTLRQWARRYEMSASHRTDGGQRLYSEQDMVRLQLVVAGREQGIRLVDMSHLSIPALADLVNPLTVSCRVYWQGPAYQRLRAGFPDIDWVTSEPGRDAEVLRVLELDTVTAVDIEQVTPVGKGRGVVIYQFACRSMQKAMTELGYELLKGPASEEWLAEQVGGQLRRRQFTSNELLQLRNMQPEMECECPNHVAAILHQLRQFAQYSLACDVQSDQQGWVHQRIFQHIRDAQQDVEAALRLIVEEEGLPLFQLPSPGSGQD